MVKIEFKSFAHTLPLFQYDHPGDATIWWVKRWIAQYLAGDTGLAAEHISIIAGGVVLADTDLISRITILTEGKWIANYIIRGPEGTTEDLANFPGNQGEFSYLITVPIDADPAFPSIEPIRPPVSLVRPASPPRMEIGSRPPGAAPLSHERRAFVRVLGDLCAREPTYSDQDVVRTLSQMLAIMTGVI